MKFQEFINQDKPILVDFYADWCGPCQAMSPILENLKTRIGKNASIIKIDIDKNPQAAKAFKVRSVPTFILFKKRKAVWRKSGLITTSELENIIRQYS